MTVPDVGARAFTITPGQPAVMLTRDAPGPNDPVTIISDDAGGCRVYVGSDGGVSASTGVPLDAGTSLPWSTEGQLWAVADTAGTAPATVRITRAIDDWQVSPVAIAALAAAALAAKGVPNVLVTSELFKGGIAAGQAQLIDVSKWASVTVSIRCITAPVVVGATLLANDLSTQMGGDVIAGTQILGQAVNATLDVLGPQLQLNNNGTGDVSITVIGSNRPALTRFDMRGDAAQINDLTLSSQAWVAGQSATLGASTAMPQGLCQAVFVYSSTVKGTYYLLDVNGTIQYVSDFVLAATFSASASTVYHVTQIIVPPGAKIGFRAAAAGTTGPHVQLAQAGF